jgi:MinD-like ATPase involved in chromosome partitioning or flagellar assembly
VAVSAELRVLTAAPRPDRWRELRPSALRTVLGTARSLADVVVVDCGAGLPDSEEHSHASTPGAITAAVLAEADVVLLVAGADPVGMVRLGHLLESVDPSTMDASPAVVVTRVRGSVVGRHPEAQVRQTLARLAPGLPAYLVPDDPVAVDRAVRRGQPVTDVAPESGLARALEALVAEVVDPEQAGGLVSSAGRRPRPPRRWARRGRSIA